MTDTRSAVNAAVASLDDLLVPYADALGGDRDAYRNHCARVLTGFAVLRGGDAQAMRRATVAVAFHDLAIWTHGTFDYLPPSEELAADHLRQAGDTAAIDPVVRMIRWHHKITPYQGPHIESVEVFRRADWADVTRGVLNFGIDRHQLAAGRRVYPNAGFHQRLVQLSLRRLRTHPLSPMPMMRW